MAKRDDPKSEAILDAAHVQFSQYGFRRTSMEDIAKQTGVSRASLYSHFENKEEIFRSLSTALHDQALADAEAKLKETGAGPLEARMVEAFQAKVGRLNAYVVESAHGSEIVDENNRLCGDVVQSSSARFQSLLVAAFKAGEKDGEVDLKGSGLSATQAAELLRMSVAGLKHDGPEPRVFRTRLERLMRVFFSGIA